MHETNKQKPRMGVDTETSHNIKADIWHNFRWKYDIFICSKYFDGPVRVFMLQ